MSDSIVKERPILFSGAMIRAILDGRKTQTRRVIKDAPDDWVPVVGPYYPAIVVRGDLAPGPIVFGASDEQYGRVCPYGMPGDRLWVRETWGVFDTDCSRRAVAYRADPEDAAVEWLECGEEDHGKDYDGKAIPCRWTADDRWRPSIYMPRWASRLTLEITDVRVQQVGAISWDDCVAEGIDHHTAPDGGNVIDGFHELWDSINAARGFAWNMDPWVWALTFRRAEGGRG